MKSKYNSLFKVLNTINLKSGTVLLLFSCLLFGYHINAQVTKADFKIKWYPNIKKNLYYQNIRVLKTDENYYCYFLSFNNGKPMSGIPTVYETLIKYDSKTEKDESFPLKLKTNGVDRERLEVFAADSAIHIVSYFNNKKHSAVYIFDETVNLNTFESNNDIHKISEIKYDKKTIKNSDDIYIRLDLDELESKKQIKLFYEYKTDEKFIRGFEAFDNLMLSKVKYELTFEKNIGVPNYIFDNDFNLYIIERIFNKDDSFLQSKVDIACYSEGGSFPVKNALNLGNLFIPKLTLSVNQNNQVICAGLYSCKGTQSATGGFSFIFNPKLKGQEIVNKVDFEQTFITNGKDKVEAEKIHKKIENCKEFEDEYYYKMHPIHHREDGGFDLIVEKRIMRYVGMDGRSYRYDDIYVLSFNPDGSNKWIRKIIRNQEINESAANYFHFLGDCIFDFGKNGEIIVIYNSVNAFLANFANESYTILVTIDKTGNQASKIIFDDPKFIKTFCPGFSMNCGNGKYIVTKMNNFSNILNSTFNIGELTIALDN